LKFQNFGSLSFAVEWERGAVADADAAEEEEEKGRRRWWRWCNWWTKSLLLTRSLTVSLPPSLLPPCPPLLPLRRRACNGAGAAP